MINEVMSSNYLFISIIQYNKMSKINKNRGKNNKKAISITNELSPYTNISK
jgi:hypothetical protein